MATKKTTRFNVSKFLAAAREAREDAVEMLKNPLIRDIRQAYAMVMDEDDYITTEYVTVAETAEDLRATLSVQAMRAGPARASDKQIEYIVALSEKTGCFEDRGGFDQLTVSRASIVIGVLQDELRKVA